MQDFCELLGVALKKAREDLGLSQEKVSEYAGITTRTLMKLENGKGNPQFHTLSTLIRVLKIDAREIFNPEMERQSPSIRLLRHMVEDCTEQEAAALLPVITSFLTAVRNHASEEV